MTYATSLNIPKLILEILLQNFELLVCFGLQHQLFVAEISDTFCHSVSISYVVPSSALQT
jgi:hypothetical protein